LQREVRHAFQPRHQFRLVTVEDGQKFIVLDVSQSSPEMGLAEKPQMREQLAKPDIPR